MKSLTSLLQCILADAGDACGVDTSQDLRTILRRTEHEGEQFLTVTLPSMVKDLYKALDQKAVTPDLFPAFHRAQGEAIPVFLGGFFKEVFDPLTGRLYDNSRFPLNPYHTAQGESERMARNIKWICQITGVFGKMFELCPDQKIREAYDRYVIVDGEVMEWDSRHEMWPVRSDLRKVFHFLFGNALNRAEQLIRQDELRPKHGPGATADKLRGNAKWAMRNWDDELELIFPQGRWAYNSWTNYLADWAIAYCDFQADIELDPSRPSPANPVLPIPSRVVAVPKTQEKPRLIAIEPTHMQYMQQAIRGVLETALFGNHRTNALIGYSSQIPNQELARMGSLDGSIATLDLSDASDRVSSSLVWDLFGDWPLLREALFATRTRSAGIADGRIISLRKFASMGSALCFPIEAMVFATLAYLGMQWSVNQELRTVEKQSRGKVRVYGDDIIVPVEHAQFVAETLESFGLKVNWRKSFWNGEFRESCGKEYWRGFDVTYVKLRKRLPSHKSALRKEPANIVSLLAFRNLLCQKFSGEVATATRSAIDQYLEQAFNGHYPTVLPTSGALGAWSENGVYNVDHTHPHLFKPMVKAYRVSVVPPASEADGYQALMKFFGKTSELPNPDPEHLLRAGRPQDLRINLGWISPC